MSVDVTSLVTENLDIWSSTIKAKSATGRGSKSKRELYGVKKLRELILDLAGRGLLVPQDPSDEPARALLLRANSYLCKQIGKTELSKLKRDKSVVNPDDYHYRLPPQWEWCELQNVALFLNGKAHEKYVTDNLEFVLINSKFVSNSGTIRKYVTDRLTPLNKGDIAMVMSDVPNGKALARCYLVEADDLYTLNQRICGLIFSPEFDREYLTLTLNRNRYLLDYNDGKKQTNLKKIQVVSCPIPIPPLAEQHRIVTKVNELMTLCDQLEQQQESSISAHQTLVETLLAALTNAGEKGEFDRAWARIAEHFDTLFTTEHSISALERAIFILASSGCFVDQSLVEMTKEEVDILDVAKLEKLELIRRGVARVEKIKPLEIPNPYSVLPEGWVLCKLDEVTCCLDHKRIPIKKSERSEGEIPYYGANGPVGYIGDYLFDEDLVLVVEDETFIGRKKPFSYRISGKSWVNNHAHVLKCTSQIDPDFLNLVLSYYPFIPLTSGTTGRKKLTKNTLLQIPIVVPPVEVQKYIIERVHELLVIGENLKNKLLTAQSTQLNLTDAIAEQAVS